MRVVSCKMDDDMVEALRRLAEERGTTFSELVRAAVRAFVEREVRPCKPFVSRRIIIRC